VDAGRLAIVAEAGEKDGLGSGIRGDVRLGEASFEAGRAVIRWSRGDPCRLARQVKEFSG
jgi:hypothetical protein